MSIVLNGRLDTEIGVALRNRLIEEMSKVEAHAANVYQSETRGRVAVIPTNFDASSKQSQMSK